jgi:hypothetical protein
MLPSQLLLHTRRSLWHQQKAYDSLPSVPEWPEKGYNRPLQQLLLPEAQALSCDKQLQLCRTALHST